MTCYVSSGTLNRTHSQSTYVVHLEYVIRVPLSARPRTVVPPLWKAVPVSSHSTSHASPHHITSYGEVGVRDRSQMSTTEDLQPELHCPNSPATKLIRSGLNASCTCSQYLIYISISSLTRQFNIHKSNQQYNKVTKDLLLAAWNVND